MSLENSMKMWSEYNSYCAGCSTFSKNPRLFPFGTYPIFLNKGEGCWVQDVDGNWYVDYFTGLGAITLGYCYPRVNKAVKKQLSKGMSFSLLNDLEVQVAKLLIQMVNVSRHPSVFFAGSGSEATNGAVRLARAYTKKDLIIHIKPSYHGWHNWFCPTHPLNTGSPGCLKNTIVSVNYNMPQHLREMFKKHKNRVAGVITEPVCYEEQEADYLKEVEEVTYENDAVLIFDEVVTFPRFYKTGFSFGATPDVVTTAKGIGNGARVAAVVGRDDILNLRREEKVFVSGTFSGETLGLTAAKETLSEFIEKPVANHIWDVGEEIKKIYNGVAEEFDLKTSCIGYPPRTCFKFEDDPDRLKKTLFLQEMIKRKILIGTVNFPCYQTGKKEVKQTTDAIVDSLFVLSDAIKKNDVKSRLRGETVGLPVMAVRFREKF